MIYTRTTETELIQSSVLSLASHLKSARERARETGNDKQTISTPTSVHSRCPCLRKMNLHGSLSISQPCIVSLIGGDSDGRQTDKHDEEIEAVEVDEAI